MGDLTPTPEAELVEALMFLGNAFATVGAVLVISAAICFWWRGH